ncbi:hypothetical protein PR202_ga15526 [Eleusine coracana subsp. coracana]|uniref:non-specific serine/threonine protein kinase n=1 Tax=Eleusine coracana subsp. coracana TaxID=191504 RepID=A0AAV5CJW6_ELECO|nr:hypothetical protein PR202_ga15526 [Eleusine coracana subsp. coracana]
MPSPLHEVSPSSVIDKDTSDTSSGPSVQDTSSVLDGDSGELKVVESLDGNGNKEKKTSQKSSTSDGFTSAKVSDGTSSLRKTSGSATMSTRADFTESGKSSMCRASTGSDISDESSCSSMSSATTKPHKGNDSRWEAIHVVKSRDNVLGLNHFRLLKKLGSGDIGSVYLSELSGTRSYFAMKVMDKTSLASRKKLLRAQTEREILQSLDHPFLPTLYTHFETDKFSCLVMEFCPGGDLHTLRQRQPGKYFSEQAAKSPDGGFGDISKALFYVAEVLLALEYLHMLGIIYRDLKPENVLVREDGHIMLSDFDLSLRCSVNPTVIKSANPGLDALQRNNGAYCVQPACIEPSCIQPSCVAPTTCFGPRFFSRSKSKTKSKSKKEKSKPETPFKGSGNRATLFNVVGQPLRFPESPIVSFSARDMIRGLLVKDPQHRLGYKRGATEIKQHPFFEGVNWALIRCASPPDVPKPVELDCRPKQVTSTNGKVAPVANQKGPDNYLEFEFF